ncbi:Lipoprotein-anchoring transpeptidase ErfK/SrfK [Verrucomicrobium sp. GAS474]|uniref:L,D-transpeptidase n=1 Tax=Verrucomicrobium sp. GAS474 TaxID=1882831 RepID=UPI00087A7A3A|nr:L,D-transpeptidase family protein [Verrucomicrobium sp. GAS474]SDT87598.1 Lipoprotein-anchoring transpeptidase ErfK/SrfK [Verrucomicrobium sp. GAS474]
MRLYPLSLSLLVAWIVACGPVAGARADLPSDTKKAPGFSQTVSSKGGSLKRRASDGEPDYYYSNRSLMPIVWEPDTTKPITKIEVQLTACKLFVYQGDKVVGATSISPGKEGYDTRPGQFEITQKDKDHHSNLYGSFVNANGGIVNDKAEAGQEPPAGLHYVAAPMLWFLRITDTGTGLHAGYVTGTPVSHGCIRMPPTFAEDLFNLAQVGTKVEVKP